MTYNSGYPTLQPWLNINVNFKRTFYGKCNFQEKFRAQSIISQKVIDVSL